MPEAHWTLNGVEGKWSYTSTGDKFTIGRKVNTPNWNIPCNKISSLHATLELKNGVWWICDHSSRNGTFVNDTRIAPGTPKEIFSFDKVKLDTYTLSWREEGEKEETVVVYTRPDSVPPKDISTLIDKPRHRVIIPSVEEKPMRLPEGLSKLLTLPAVPVAPKSKSESGDRAQKVYAGRKRKLQEHVLNALNLAKNEEEETDPIEREAKIEQVIKECTSLIDLSGMSPGEKKRLVHGLLADMVRLGPLHPFLLDESITEIIVYPNTSIWVERAGKLRHSGEYMDDHNHIMLLIERMLSGEVNRRVDYLNPMVTARLQSGPAEGCRLAVTLPPSAPKGPTFTIRKFTEGLNLTWLLRNDTLSENMSAYLIACVVARRNILVLGGTGSGKTSILKSLAEYIPPDQRILVLEDTREIEFEHPLVDWREARPANVEGKGEIDIPALLRQALRERPDRIIVGEVRGKEVIQMLQAMNTGHEGSMSTVHANDIGDAMRRMEIMMNLAAPDLPHIAAQAIICSALHVLVHVQRFTDGTRRVSEIAELTWDEKNKCPSIHKLFEYCVDGFDKEGKVLGHFQPVASTHLNEVFGEYNVHLDPAVFTA